MCSMKRSDCSTTEGACFGLTRLVRRLRRRERMWGMIGLSTSNMEKQRAEVIIRVLFWRPNHVMGNPGDKLKQPTSDANK